MGTGKEISEDYQDMVRSQGDQVLIHTQECVLWSAEHKNCKGCISELGCGKAVAMLGISLTPMMYHPKDYEDYEKMQASMLNKMDRILNAKSPEEIHAITG